MGFFGLLIAQSSLLTEILGPLMTLKLAILAVIFLKFLSLFFVLKLDFSNLKSNASHHITSMTMNLKRKLGVQNDLIVMTIPSEVPRVGALHSEGDGPTAVFVPSFLDKADPDIAESLIALSLAETYGEISIETEMSLLAFVTAAMNGLSLDIYRFFGNEILGLFGQNIKIYIASYLAVATILTLASYHLGEMLVAKLHRLNHQRADLLATEMCGKEQMLKTLSYLKGKVGTAYKINQNLGEVAETIPETIIYDDEKKDFVSRLFRTQLSLDERLAALAHWSKE
jgi:hypothetical protein